MPFVPEHRVTVAPGAAPERTGVVLHGILGSERNWRTMNRRLAAALPAWRWLGVDLRAHGESVGAPPPHTIAACADDLAALAEREGPFDVMIGHSFGGKVALAYAERFAIRQVWALDITPGLAGAGDSDVLRVIAALRAVPMPVASRADVADALRALGQPEAIAQWMTTNLRRTDGGLVWSFDLDAVEALIADHARVDLWPSLAAPRADVHFVRGGRSDRWTDAILRRLEALPVAVHTLPDAGHWVHVDDPDGLLAVLARVIPGGPEADR